MTLHQAKKSAGGVAKKVANKVVPPAAAREALLWVLVVLCQSGYQLGPMVGHITGLPVAAHHAPPAPIAEGPQP